MTYGKESSAETNLMVLERKSMEMGLSMNKELLKRADLSKRIDRQNLQFDNNIIR